FSSRRRHTRFSRDWSSDVCSSDLVSVSNPNQDFLGFDTETTGGFNWWDAPDNYGCRLAQFGNWDTAFVLPVEFGGVFVEAMKWRSEERRVGKEGRVWVSGVQLKIP